MKSCLSFLAFILFYNSFVFPQSEPDLTLEKQPLIILASEKGDDDNSIESVITTIVSSEATKLGRFIIMDRSNLEAVLEEQSLQMTGIISDNDLVQFGEIASAREALIIKVINFNQKGVPPEDEEEEEKKDRKKARESGLFGILAKKIVDAAIDEATKKVEKYPNNIQTVLHFEVRKVDIETGQSLNSFTVRSNYTGGNRAASLNRVLGKVSSRVQAELKELYLLASEVIDVRGNQVTLLLGKEMGLRKGTVFEIKTIPTVREVRGRTITIPGETVGFVKVQEISRDSNRGNILRSWERIEPGYRAVESTGGITCVGTGFSYAPGTPEMNLEFKGLIAPFNKIGGAAFFGLGLINDARKEMDFYLRFGGSVSFRFIQTSPFSLAGVFNLPLNLVFKQEDERLVSSESDFEDSHVVTSFLLTPNIGLEANIMMNPKMDVTLSAGYLLGSIHSRWKYSIEDPDDEEETITKDAYWDPSLISPDVEATGFYLSVGIRFFIF